MKNFEQLKNLIELCDSCGVKEEETFRLSKYFNECKIRSLTTEELENIKQRSRIINKKGEVLKFDDSAFQCLICATGTVDPNFNNAELVKQAKVTNGKELVEKVLKPGEIDRLAKRIIKLSGFDDDVEEEVEETKKH